MLGLDRLHWLASTLFILATAISSSADEKPIPAKPYSPPIAEASDEGEKAMARFKLAPGMKVELFAAEPMLANPVCFTVDNKGRFFVGETFRHHAGVTDMRDHQKWLDDDLACRTIEDRLASMKKNLGDAFATYSGESDRVRMIEDKAGKGKADHATVFADGFNHALDGIGAGLLVDRGEVYYTCIPDLWKLQDTNGDGVADTRQSLSSGYGVHINYLGHDLHGLRKGPDGKIYFSIGDRGFNVKTLEGTYLECPDTGAVLRCNPDGTHLEIFHKGLRNPQELAFDDYGNLFTGDNNSDGGDKARWVYVVEGGDSGWTIGWQWIKDPNPRGAWNSEKMWYPQWKGQAAYLVPPIENIAAGPSGLAYYPGTGLPADYRGHFFLCDFRGDAGSSLIHTFTVKPKGASFELLDPTEFVKGVLVTDCDFGVNGGLYLTDWVQGWEKTAKGRIYRIFEPTALKDPNVGRTKRLLAEGMTKKAEMDLADLLLFPDQRVRLEAQWELADRGEKSQEILFMIATTSEKSYDQLIKEGVPSPKILKSSERRLLDLLSKTSKNELARIHAIWALGQIQSRLDPRSPAEPSIFRRLLDDMRKWGRAIGDDAGDPYNFINTTLELLLEDDNAEIRAQATKMLAGGLVAGSPGQTPLRSGVAEKLIARLKDPSPRVKFFAAIGLGKVGRQEAADTLDPLIAMLKENNDADPYLRHAAVMGLAGSAKPEALLAKAKNESAAVRMGILLTLRRLGRPEVARFLRDSDPLLIAEAARAINDAPIEAAFPDLAALTAKAEEISGLIDVGIDPAPILVRSMNANYRLGGAQNASALARLASSGKIPEPQRIEALYELREWEKPSGRDRVAGVWRPIAPRDPAIARQAAGPIVANLLQERAEKIQQEAAKLAARYEIAEAGPTLFALVGTKQQPARSRIEALRALAALKDPQLATAVTIARGDEAPALRAEANAQLAKLDPAEAARALSLALATGSVIEKQGAFQTLAELQTGESEHLISEWMDRLISGVVPPEIQFDLLQAAEQHAASADLKSKMEKYKASIRTDDSLGGFRDLLMGGSAEKGEKTFFESQAASCQRCHTVHGKGGGEVGPELTGIGARATRDHILESIVFPNKEIAKGFENVTLTMTDGKEHTGRVVNETDSELQLEVELNEVGEEFKEETKGDAAKPEAGAAKAPVPTPKPKLNMIAVPKAQIKSRQHNLSSMPEGIVNEISRGEIRDLVEYLAGLK